jgi:ribose transport system substrate-binding protein
MRQGKVTAANIISSEWTGWASADTLNSLFRKEQTVDSGIGWTIADSSHNLPPAGDFVPPIDFKSQFKKAWGV